jgi:hypothetical protein
MKANFTAGFLSSKAPPTTTYEAIGPTALSQINARADSDDQHRRTSPLLLSTVPSIIPSPA